MMAVIALAVTVAGLVYSASLIQQNLLFTHAQTEVSFWGRGDYQPTSTTIAHTVQQLESLLQREPKQPDYLGLQANAFVWLAYWADDGGVRVKTVQQAIDSQYAALQFRPAHRYSWVKLGEYLPRGAATEANAALTVLTQSRLSLLAVTATP
jgi:pectin methylesterase-like acyl-CoA thioesterase